MNIKKTLIFTAFITGTISLWSAHPFVRNYSRKESGSGTQNWSIGQAANDWMYFANNNGLLEYDGVHWNIYPISNYTNVRSIYIDRSSDRIYAGAFNEFGFYQRTHTGKMTYTSLSSKVSTADRDFSEIWNIFQQGNAICFQGNNVLFSYEHDSLKATRFGEKISAAANAHNSIIIAQQKKGVSVLNGNLQLPIPNSELVLTKKIVAILPVEKNQILFVSENDGIFKYDGINIQSYPTPADRFIKDNQIFCATYHNQKLAIGTVRKGMVLIDLQTGELVYANTNSGLQNNTILSIAFDRNQNLWLGLDKGIDYVMVNEPVYDLVGKHNLYGSGYTSAVYNNTLYLGTNQGLYYLRLPLTSDINTTDIQAVEAIKGQIWHLSVHDNTLFCGSDHGCYLIEGQKIRHLAETIGTWALKPIPGRHDLLLGSSYNGFFLLQKEAGRWQFAHFVKGFTETGSNYEFDRQGTIWLSHWIKGVYRLTLSDDWKQVAGNHQYTIRHGLPANDNNRIFQYNDSIYMNTTQGVYQYQASSDRFIKSDVKRHPAFRHTLPYSRIIQQNRQWTWAYNNRVIKKITQQPGILQIDSVSFSLLTNKLIPGFEHSTFINDTIGILGTEDGFAVIKPSRATLTQPTLHVAIRKVYLTGVTDSLLQEYSPGQAVIPEIKPRYNSIRFEFNATEFRNESVVQYSYRLEPSDQDWSDYNSSNSKEFTNLAGGHYRFRLKAKNNYNASEGETMVEFIILPHWYETLWAKMVYLLLFALAFTLVVRTIRRHSEQRIERVKQLKEKELTDQKEKFLLEANEKEREIISLRNQKLHYELRHKSQDLANSTMNLIRKNEMLLGILQKIDKIATELQERQHDIGVQKQLKKIQDDIRNNIETDNNWKKFQENFDMVYENFLKRLGEEYPGLSSSDKKLCAYLKMELSSKDIAPLMNMSYRSVEMSRYRLRKKFDLNRETNLIDFLRQF